MRTRAAIATPHKHNLCRFGAICAPRLKVTLAAWLNGSLSRSPLSHAELVHADEDAGILGLEDVPLSQIRHREIGRKAPQIALLRLWFDIETKKLQIIFGNERPDLRQRQIVLL